MKVRDLACFRVRSVDFCALTVHHVSPPKLLFSQLRSSPSCSPTYSPIQMERPTPVPMPTVHTAPTPTTPTMQKGSLWSYNKFSYDALRKTLREAWDAVTLKQLNELTEFMPARCQAVITADGRPAGTAQLSLTFHLEQARARSS